MAKWNRRQFLSGLLATVGVEAAVEAEARLLPPPAQNALASSTLPARDLGSPAPPVVPSVSAAPAPDGSDHALRELLPEGLRFGRWRVVAVHPVKYGAVPVILATRSGERFQVDILRRDRRHGAKQGVARTRHFALHLANVGRGVTPTREEHGVGILWLAALLRTRENRVQVPALLTLRDRVARHPSGRFDALRGTERTASPAAWGPILSPPELRAKTALVPALTAATSTPLLPLPRGRGGDGR